MDLVNVDFKPMAPGELEYILDDSSLPKIKIDAFEVIADEEALELYFPTPEGWVAIYCPSGAQRGDEGKGKGTRLISRIDPLAKWGESVVGTHNAGKGVTTENIKGEEVRLTLNLLPVTVVEPDQCNYIRAKAKVNPFNLEQEVERLHTTTGRTRLLTQEQVLDKESDMHEGYHLMLDSKVCLTLPVNRAYDVVNKEDAMGSTIAGSTGVSMAMAGKFAPTIEDVLYDKASFIRQVKKQIRMFNDELRHDEEWQDLGITDMASFGEALQDVSVYRNN